MEIEAFDDDTSGSFHCQSRDADRYNEDEFAYGSESLVKDAG